MPPPDPLSSCFHVSLSVDCGCKTVKGTDSNATDYLVDATFQGLAYYTMSSMTNDAFKLARMAACKCPPEIDPGFAPQAYKCPRERLQGYTVCWCCCILWYGCGKGTCTHHKSPSSRANMQIPKTPYLAELLISWLLIMVSLPLCALVLHSIRDTNYDVEEVVHVDDTK